MKPESTLHHISNFTRIEHTAFSLPLIFTGAWLGAGNRFPSVGVMLLIVVAALGARIFGMAMNRVFDRQIDRMNPRTAGRELPAGKISLGMALAIAFTGLIVYLMACWIAGRVVPDPVAHPPGPAVGLFTAEALHRLLPFRHRPLPGPGALGAYVAAAGHPRFSAAAILFSGFVFCWLSGADIIYALMDIDSDRQNHIHSLPARLGADGALRVAAGVHLMAWGILVAVVQTVGGSADGLDASDHGGPVF
jgi:4-hydroxybenzoate polyprenyltransferase